MAVNIGTNIPQSEVVEMFVLKTNIKKGKGKLTETAVQNIEGKGKEKIMSKSLEKYVEHRVQTATLKELKEFMREQLLDICYEWEEEELVITKEEDYE